MVAVAQPSAHHQQHSAQSVWILASAAVVLARNCFTVTAKMTIRGAAGVEARIGVNAEHDSSIVATTPASRCTTAHISSSAMLIFSHQWTAHTSFMNGSTTRDKNTVILRCEQCPVEAAATRLNEWRNTPRPTSHRLLPPHRTTETTIRAPKTRVRSTRQLADCAF